MPIVQREAAVDFAVDLCLAIGAPEPVSYTHLTLPTN